MSAPWKSKHKLSQISTYVQVHKVRIHDFGKAQFWSTLYNMLQASHNFHSRNVLSPLWLLCLEFLVLRWRDS